MAHLQRVGMLYFGCSHYGGEDEKTFQLVGNSKQKKKKEKTSVKKIDDLNELNFQLLRLFSVVFLCPVCGRTAN